MMKEDPNSPQALWRGVNGDETLKLDYPLNSESHVVEIGGYKGDWTAAMLQKYSPLMTVFEPVEEYAKAISNRFAGDRRVVVIYAALGAENGRVPIVVCGDGSNLYGQGMAESPTRQDVLILDVATAFGKSRIDLMSLNAEGAEFEILPRMVETSVIKQVKFLQVQFHPWWPDAEKRRREILSLLHPTHKIHYSYEFLWEAWERR